MFPFIITNILLGVGLAMDAFSVSLANGLKEPNMKKGKLILIAFMFAFFQALMPMLGWVCVHTVAEKFGKFQVFIPWIALVLLLFIGGKMLIESLKKKNDEEEEKEVKTTFLALIVQGIATSIDALSVGFTISEYDITHALLAAGIIALVTFIICVVGVILGKLFGMKFEKLAGILGGVILIGIGLEIFITGVFF